MKKRKLLLTALCLTSVSAFAFGLAACNNDKPEEPAPHSHSWSAWTVSETNEPTDAATGKATRTCSGTGDCDATATDKEYTLPNLTSTDYSKTADTATCSAAGEITYTYNKDGVNVSFDIDTPINASAHKYGAYQKAETESEGHYQVCEHNGAHKTNVVAHDEDGEDGACSECGYKPTTENPPTPTHTNHTWGDWTVTDKPEKIKPGKATRTCTYDGCNEVDTEEIELPPLASALEYTITDNTASCTEGGTATYTYTDDNDNTVSFTAATDAKGHKYGEVSIVEGVPVSTCAACGNKLPAELSGTINPSMESKTFFAGGDLEYTLSAYSGAVGYYTFTYEGEKEIQVEYTYATMKDGEINGTVTLSGSGSTSLTVYLETKATCVMKITSTEETAFIGEISLEFSVNDPSYVIPELSVGLTTVSATYMGTVYEFTAPVSGSYTLSCESEDAVIILDGTAEALTLPYTFTLGKDATISFVMSCEEETAEYDVQIALGLSGSGTYSDPYLITEDFLAVNIGATIKNGETKYYKIAADGKFMLNCLPLVAEGSYPTFVSDKYTSTEYTAEITVLDEKITVTGWKVTGIVSENGAFIFALTGSGSDATDSVQLYFDYLYGSEKNHYDWVSTYFFIDYEYYSDYEVGDTVYIDFVPTVSSRVTLNFAHISTVKYNGKTITTNGAPFAMFVVEGETYTFECTTSYLVNGAELRKTKALVTNLENGSINVTLPATNGIDIDENVLFTWWTFSEGSEAVPFKITDSGEVELFANGSTFFTVDENKYVTFNFGSGINAKLNGTPITSGVKYSITTEDLVEFVNSGSATSVSCTVADSLGEETNPFLIQECNDGTITVNANSNYYLKAFGNSDLTLTFTGVTITCDGKTIISGTEFRANNGDIFVIANSGNTAVTVSYNATAILGTKNNPKELIPETAEEVTEETYFTVTITGDGNYQIVMSDPVSEKIMAYGLTNGIIIEASEDEYAVYGVIVQYNGFYYAFDANGVLCEVEKHTDNTNGRTQSVTTGLYNNGENANAYVAKKENVPLYLTEGTYILRVVKNTGEAAYLEDMSIGCKITVENTSVIEYTVDFVTNKAGVTVQSQQVEVGGTATMETPESEGYLFYAWYTDAELKNKFDFSTKIGKDTTLYALWVETDGLKDSPITAVEGENSGVVYALSDFQVGLNYYHIYEYIATKDCELKISVTKSSQTAVRFTSATFEELFVSGGNRTTITAAGTLEGTIIVKANDKIYLAACNFNVGSNGVEYGNYSFTITVVTTVTPPDIPQPTTGDGTKGNPYKAELGVYSGNTAEVAYNEDLDGYFLFYTYTATAEGKLVFTCEADDTTGANMSLNGWDEILNIENEYYLDGNSNSKYGVYESEIEVQVGDIVYIVIGTYYETDNYSVTISFVGNGNTGDGTKENPYKAELGVYSGNTAEVAYNEDLDGYFLFYTYTATAAGKLVFTCEADDTTGANMSLSGWDEILNIENEYYLDGNSNSKYGVYESEIEVQAGDIVYIVIGTYYETDNYSVTILFVG